MMVRLRRFLKQLLHPGQNERELDAELRFHVESYAEELMRRQPGLTEQQARRQAQLEFGGLEQMKEETRDQRLTIWLEDLIRDSQYAARMMRKSPVLSAAAIGSLALGIGANTAIFSLMDTILLRALPVVEPSELHTLGWRAEKSQEDLFDAFTGSWNDSENGPTTANAFSYVALQAMEQNKPAGTEIASFGIPRRASASIGEVTALVDLQVVSGTYHQVFRVRPQTGRLLQPADDAASAPDVAVISYRYWQSQLGGTPLSRGAKLKINQVPFEIVGITPKGFFGHMIGLDPDITIPLAKVRAIEPEFVKRNPFGSARYWWLQAIARTPASAARGEVTGRLDAALLSSLDVKPKSDAQVPRVTMAPAAKGINDLKGDFAEPLVVLMGVVGIVLLIASANVANLLLARAIARQREVSVRFSLGASQGRLVRQFLAEFLLLAAIGAALSVFLAVWITNHLVPLVPSYWEIRLDTALNWRTLTFTAAVSLLVTFLFGMIPALRASRLDVAHALKDNAGSLGGVRRKIQAPRIIVVLQVALSMILLGGAALFIASLRNLDKADLGFRKENLVLFTVDPAQLGYHDERLVNFYLQVLDHLRATPGVIAASGSTNRPLTGGGSYSEFRVEASGEEPEKKSGASRHDALPGFIEALGIPVVAGRTLADGDRKSTGKVAVINEVLAQKLFGNRNPVGEALLESSRRGPGTRYQIAGVVRNARYEKVKGEFPAIVYLPFLQRDPRDSEMTFAVRTAADPVAMLPALRRAVAQVDGEVPLGEVRTQEEQIDQLLRQERLFAMLTSAFAGLALLLSSVGLFGVMTSLSNRRRNEIGLRMALGAARSSVVWLVMRSGLMLVSTGFALGLGLAIYCSRFVGRFLYGVKPLDPGAILVAAAVLLSVATFAAWLPAFRASRIDPITAIRYE